MTYTVQSSWSNDFKPDYPDCACHPMPPYQYPIHRNTAYLDYPRPYQQSMIAIRSKLLAGLVLPRLTMIATCALFMFRGVVVRRLNVTTHSFLYLAAWLYVAVVGWELYLVYHVI